MLLYFNKNGQLLEQLEYGSVPRVGMTTFSILAYFQDIDLSDYGAALIRFKRPDINGSEYPSLFMTRNPSFIYDSNVESSRYFNVQNNPYDIYTFNFNTVSDGDSGAIQTLLDTPGMWQASITLVNTSGGSNVTGLVRFMVEGSVSSADDDETNIDYDSIIHNVAVAMSSKLDKGDLQYIRYDGDFVSDATNGTLLKAIFVVGCHVFDNTTQDWYVINSVTDTTEGYVSATYSKISIVPNKQMTACVIINAITNINRRVLSNFEATHYNQNWDASDGYEHYHITYGGEELTEAQAKSYMRHMCGSEHLPVYDYEYPQNSLFIMANGSFWKPQWGGGSGIHDGFNLIALPNPFALQTWTQDNFVPYTGATGDLAVGNHNIYAGYNGNYIGVRLNPNGIVEVTNDNNNRGQYRYNKIRFLSNGTAYDLIFPEANGTIATQEYTNNGFVKKTQTTKTLYGKDESGNEASLLYGQNTTGSSIVQRDSSGNIEVPLTPTSSEHATSKEYVVGEIQETMETININKQDTLVSGTNIKTVNGTSLLGSGNIEIEGGTKLYRHILYNNNRIVAYIIDNNVEILTMNNWSSRSHFFLKQETYAAHTIVWSLADPTPQINSIRTPDFYGSPVTNLEFEIFVFDSDIVVEI